MIHHTLTPFSPTLGFVAAVLFGGFMINFITFSYASYVLWNLFEFSYCGIAFIALFYCNYAFSLKSQTLLERDK